MTRCFVTRELPGPALSRLAAEHQLDIWGESTPPPAVELRRRAAQAGGLLALLTDTLDAELLDACPQLGAISIYAVGTDNVDVAAATVRGIPVGNTPDVLTDSTADLAVGLMLAVARRLAEGERTVRKGRWLTWEPGFMLGRDLNGTCVGIVGPGRIGRAVAERLAGFRCRVITASRNRDELESLLREADFVTVHVPLAAETRGLIGERELRLMKPTSYLVNTARGPLVESAALVRALTEGWIAGAALDVTDPEPLPPDHPLLTAPNLLVLPHLGSATHATRERMADLAVDNLLAGLAGRPLPHEFPGG